MDEEEMGWVESVGVGVVDVEGCEARRRCKAWRTIRPAMTALVVAIAGMMFPAISVCVLREGNNVNKRPK